MIKNLFFFPNGNVAATDEEGVQVFAEQAATWDGTLEQLLEVLRDKLRRGVVSSETRVWVTHLVEGAEEGIALGEVLAQVEDGLA